MNLSILMTALLAAAMVTSMEMEDNCTKDRGLKCKSNTKLVPGSKYTVKSKCKNGKYSRNERCSWRFNFQGCKPVISCDYINTRKGKGKRCRGGDKLIMSSSVGWGCETVFCGKRKSTTVTPVHASDIAAEQDYLDIKFSANRKRKGKRGRGFQCQVTCEEPAEPINDCRCGVANNVSHIHRIVNGTETDKNEYPWHVMLWMLPVPMPYCGGSILSNRTILTAAHCVDQWGVENITVVVGEHNWKVEGDGEKRINVCEKVIHPNYGNRTWPIYFDYDIAILTLCGEGLNFTKEIAPVCPPSLPDSDYANVPAIVMGWGRLFEGGPQPDELMELEVNTTTNTECSSEYENTDMEDQVTDSMICAAQSTTQDSCQGDSGGPLVTDEGGYYSQIGVVSWGKGCARYPGVYARVTSAARFIQDNIKGATCPPPK